MQGKTIARWIATFLATGVIAGSVLAWTALIVAPWAQFLMIFVIAVAVAEGFVGLPARRRQPHNTND
jgi:hypothetical protein